HCSLSRWIQTALSNSKNAVRLSSACTTNRFPSSRYAFGALENRWPCYGSLDLVFLNLVSSVSIRGQNSFLQPRIDTDFWSLPAASGRVHIIDDVCQRCGAGEHKRPLPVDSRQRAGAEAHLHHVALPIAPGEAALARIPERAAVIAQDLVEGKAKVTVSRNPLDEVA